MFAGIVEQLGYLDRRAGERFTFSWPGLDEVIPIGASVAVNGACLSVVSMAGEVFEVDVVPETLGRTNLAELVEGDRVNMERSLRLSSRVDGHIVQGHVDEVGTVLRPAPDLKVSFRAEMSKYLVEKGSICVDGVSLTVVEAGEGVFTVAIIPHTASLTTLGLRGPGDRVNLEFDVISKYVERLVAHAL